MSGPFTEQGKSAASIAPFAKWCKEQKHPINFSLEKAMDTKMLRYQRLWNTVLEAASKQGVEGVEASDTALAELRSHEAQPELD